ncbi:hypothetical protein GRJ2_000713300 [Grus japonensis]|uniref:Uncharacterized protein n=1 Tax=Grus japonensis TaxID=30415 RepID=A0ABC9WAY9_GRUJA
MCGLQKSLHHRDLSVAAAGTQVKEANWLQTEPCLWGSPWRKALREGEGSRENIFIGCACLRSAEQRSPCQLVPSFLF